ncbi:baseplate J-like protein [Leptospira phage vB_LbrZ_5399-LE1]|nr:baseplate J-like protein [Leptospira phage vB_LbrZ_5399-LE1]
MYNAFGFSRLPGLNSVGIVRFEVSSALTSDLTFPVFHLDLFGLSYSSIAPVTLKTGQTYSEIELKASSPGTDYNIKASSIDTSLGLGSLDITLPKNVHLWNPSDFSGGTNIESEESRLKRFQDFILSLGRSTTLGVYNAALSVIGVAGVQITTNVNPVSNLFETGWVNLYVSDGTSNPSKTLLERVRKTVVGDLNDPVNFPGYAAAGVFVTVNPIPVIGVTCDFTLELLTDSRLSNSDALSIAINALVLYINTLPVGFYVLLDQVKATLLKSHPDFYEVNINFLYAKLSTDPVPSPTPPPTDVSIAINYLPRTGGTTGGVVSGNIIRISPP